MKLYKIPDTLEHRQASNKLASNHRLIIPTFPVLRFDFRTYTYHTGPLFYLATISPLDEPPHERCNSGGNSTTLIGPNNHPDTSDGSRSVRLWVRIPPRETDHHATAGRVRRDALKKRISCVCQQAYQDARLSARRLVTTVTEIPQATGCLYIINKTGNIHVRVR